MRLNLPEPRRLPDPARYFTARRFRARVHWGALLAVLALVLASLRVLAASPGCFDVSFEGDAVNAVPVGAVARFGIRSALSIVLSLGAIGLAVAPAKRAPGRWGHAAVAIIAIAAAGPPLLVLAYWLFWSPMSLAP